MENKAKVFFLTSLMLGCLFPDLIRGPLLMITNALPFKPDFAYTYPLLILHSPVPLFLQAWLFSQFFEKDLRKPVFLNFLSGILVHLILDSG